MKGLRSITVGDGLMPIKSVPYKLKDRLLAHVKRVGTNQAAFGRDAIREKLDRDEQKQV